jgi:hypothetical protein
MCGSDHFHGNAFMATGDPGQPRVFIPKFPIYIPCKIDGDGRVMPLQYKDDTTNRVLLFTDKLHCRTFGARYGFSDWLPKAGRESLVQFLREMSQLGSDTVWLDPQSGGPTECAIPIGHAIFRLEHTADPPEDDNAE